MPLADGSTASQQHADWWRGQRISRCRSGSPESACRRNDYQWRESRSAERMAASHLQFSALFWVRERIGKVVSLRNLKRYRKLSLPFFIQGKLGTLIADREFVFPGKSRHREASIVI